MPKTALRVLLLPIAVMMFSPLAKGDVNPIQIEDRCEGRAFCQIGSYFRGSQVFNDLWIEQTDTSSCVFSNLLVTKVTWQSPRGIRISKSLTSMASQRFLMEDGGVRIEVRGFDSAEGGRVCLLTPGVKTDYRLSLVEIDDEVGNRFPLSSIAAEKRMAKFALSNTLRDLRGSVQFLEEHFKLKSVKTDSLKQFENEIGRLLGGLSKRQDLDRKTTGNSISAIVKSWRTLRSSFQIEDDRTILELLVRGDDSVKSLAQVFWISE